MRREPASLSQNPASTCPYEPPPADQHGYEPTGATNTHQGAKISAFRLPAASPPPQLSTTFEKPPTSPPAQQLARLRRDLQAASGQPWKRFPRPVHISPKGCTTSNQNPDRLSRVSENRRSVPPRDSALLQAGKKSRADPATAVPQQQRTKRGSSRSPAPPFPRRRTPSS